MGRCDSTGALVGATLTGLPYLVERSNDEAIDH